MAAALGRHSYHPFAELVARHDPVRATELGIVVEDRTLGAVDGATLADFQAARVSMLARVEAETAPVEGSLEWLEREVLGIELRTDIASAEVIRAPFRAPYWYAERAGQALSDAIALDDADGGAEAVRTLLHEMPGYFADATTNLGADVPPNWALMGSSTARGLVGFISRAVGASTRATSVPGLEAASDAACAALSEFARHCDSLSVARDDDAGWRCGVDYFEELLRDFQQVDFSAEELAAWGWQQVSHAESRLVAFAAELDGTMSWHEQINRAKDDHPEPMNLLRAYGSAVEDVLQRVQSADIVTFPADESCAMEWAPEYMREGLPLGCILTVAPYGEGLRSRFLITPSDENAAPRDREEHLRDNSFAFINSIVGHETYPGHHLQSALHKTGTRPDSILRYASSPQFVEGWGLYVEDLLEETGAVTDPTVHLLTRRNALWRALRVVIDVGLHTQNMPVAQAVDLLVERAGMDRHMASGEVQRYTRHDNPTYPSSYALGRRGFHRLRRQMQAKHGSSFSLRDFHDAALAHGSPPLALLERFWATA